MVIFPLKILKVNCLVLPLIGRHECRGSLLSSPYFFVLLEKENQSYHLTTTRRTERVRLDIVRNQHQCPSLRGDYTHHPAVLLMRCSEFKLSVRLWRDNEQLDSTSRAQVKNSGFTSSFLVPRFYFQFLTESC